MTTRRLKACVDAWPGCYEGGYDPFCCRFPKSCSCEIDDPESVETVHRGTTPIDIERAVRAGAEVLDPSAFDGSDPHGDGQSGQYRRDAARQTMRAALEAALPHLVSRPTLDDLLAAIDAYKPSNENTPYGSALRDAKLAVRDAFEALT